MLVFLCVWLCRYDQSLFVYFLVHFCTCDTLAALYIKCLCVFVSVCVLVRGSCDRSFLFTFSVCGEVYIVRGYCVESDTLAVLLL